jgi:phosphate-selective porin OprO/OprP
MKRLKLLVLLFVLIGFGVNISFAQDTEVKKGLKVKPELKMHGRIQYDFEFLKMKDGLGEGKDYKFKGQEFRRVYLSASGKIFKNIKYKAQFEFAGGEIAYRDVYIKFTKLPFIGGDLSVGSVAEATGLDMATSSKYIPFLERAMMTATQNFRWNSGIHYSNFGILNGLFGLQMSYAFNGKHSDGFKDKALGNGGHFVARLTSPIYKNKEKHQLVHLGVNYENRKRSEEAADYTLKFRPENHMGGKAHVNFKGLENQSDIGFELAANFGAASFQGEYEIAKYNTTDKSYNVKGFYAAMTYFVTGGHRGYKKGAYSRVKPMSNFCLKDGGLGAIELVARYSSMNFSSVITDGINDKVNNITFGFNWYLNSHSRLMYNHVITDFNAGENANNLNADLIRLQVDF